MVGQGRALGVVVVVLATFTHLADSDPGSWLSSSSVQIDVSTTEPADVPEPSIDPSTPRRVRAFAGTTVLMPCVVNNLGHRSVSWVRHHDIHVLTVGRFTFTSDARFEAHHDDGSNEWLLRLRSPTVSDSGIYECQINTKPTVSHLTTLQVLEPRAVVTAGRELFLDTGSTLRLTCQVVDAPAPAEHLLWYHERKVSSRRPCRPARRRGVYVVGGHTTPLPPSPSSRCWPPPASWGAAYRYHSSWCFLSSPSAPPCSWRPEEQREGRGSSSRLLLSRNTAFERLPRRRCSALL